jgi:hypothetical protein
MARIWQGAELYLVATPAVPPSPPRVTVHLADTGRAAVLTFAEASALAHDLTAWLRSVERTATYGPHRGSLATWPAK